MGWLDVESVTGYRTNDPQRELYRHLENRLSPLETTDDPLNRCAAQPCARKGSDRIELRVDRALTQVARIDGAHLRVFPDVTFVRIRVDRGRDLAYTLVLNKGYKNLTSIFEDEDNRDLDDDTLTVLKGLEGSYPNFFFVVDLDEIESFAERYAAIRTREDYERFVALYGIRRTNADFWAVADWFHDRYVEQEPIRAGLFDLNRYHNR